MKKTISIVIGIAIIGLISWRLVSNKQEIDSRKEINTEKAVVMVTVAEVSRQAPSGTLELTGTAQAFQEVMVPAEAAGTITEIHFKLGEYVRKGKLLARIDDKYKTLAVETAQLNHDKAQDDYERYQKMHAGEAVTETQLRDAKMAYENSKIQLDQAKKQLQDTRITAPFNGYITSKNIEKGTFVNISTPIAGIADIAQLKVLLSVSESDAYLLKSGQEVTIRTRIYPDATYSGRISHISPKGDQAHTYPVEIIISNTSDNPLKAGTYVNVSIDRGSMEPVLAIPRNGIVSSIKEPSVYVVQEDNTVRLRNIHIGKEHRELY
ncbi:MAG: efflux RND transporter periplasmic adaptor subunit [Candidatus Azobacteroides sp.]|nr:efflux RND transporter periplasmic adaptor subunit [Candidatus Azobacteroides sp.]